jgi:hypothetical protein
MGPHWAHRDRGGRAPTSKVPHGAPIHGRRGVSSLVHHGDPVDGESVEYTKGSMPELARVHGLLKRQSAPMKAG